MRRRAVLVGAVLVVALAGCGGDDGGDEATDAEDTSTAVVDDADAMTTTSDTADDSAGDDFCAQVEAVKELSQSLGLGPGSVPGSSDLEEIRDAQAAIDPPAELAEVWAQNLEYSDEGIAIAKEAEANGKSNIDAPYLSQSLALAKEQAPGALEIDGYVQEHCGFSTRLG
jgi:hypothetical protein